MTTDSFKNLLKNIPLVLTAKRFVWKTIILRQSKESFLQTLPEDAKILDVGCGNNSPYQTKQILPKCNYTGLDVGDYNQTKPLLADTYIISSPEGFASEIAKFSSEFDAVVSTHNIEHCNDRTAVFDAMLAAVKCGGFLYLAFPCESSVNFPARGGTLNYYDDETHKDVPPDFDSLIETLRSKKFKIKYSVRRYRPWFHYLIGMLNEGSSRRENKTYYSTWAYYGFESIIIAQRL